MTLRDAYRQICLAVGYDAASEFFDEAKSSTERRANANSGVRFEDHIEDFEVWADAYAFTTSRFRQYLQKRNHGDDAADVETIHAALMRMKARNPRDFGGDA